MLLRLGITKGGGNCMRLDGEMWFDGNYGICDWAGS